jgi:hypothetical protein
LSQAETREIIAELKALIMEALEILSDKEEPVLNTSLEQEQTRKTEFKDTTETEPCCQALHSKFTKT